MNKLIEFKTLPLDQVKEVDEFRDFIPENNMYDKIKDDISKNGIKVPITVNQKLEVINGYTRLRIAKELGMKEIPVAVYETSGRSDDYDLLISTNLAQRQLTRAQAVALIEKVVESKMNLIENGSNKQRVVEWSSIQLVEQNDKKIQNMTEIKNAVKAELQKHGVSVNDYAINEYIRLKENATWLANLVIEGKLGIDVAYKIYTKLKEMKLLDSVASLSADERSKLIIDGKRLILDGNKDLLLQIINKEYDVTNIQTRKRLRNKSGNRERKPRKTEKYYDDDEEEEQDQDDVVDNDDKDYPMLEEWKKASEGGNEDFTVNLKNKGFTELPIDVALIKVDGKCYAISANALRDIEQGFSEKWSALLDFLKAHNIVVPSEEEGIYIIPWKSIGRCNEWK